MTALRLPVEAEKLPCSARGCSTWIVRDPGERVAVDADLGAAFARLAERQAEVRLSKRARTDWPVRIAQERRKWETVAEFERIGPPPSSVLAVGEPLYRASDFEHATACNGNPHLPRGTAGCSCLFRERATFKDSLIAGDAWNAAALIENAAMNARPAPSEHAR